MAVKDDFKSPKNGSGPEDHNGKAEDDTDYGILETPNIGTVHFGDYDIIPWYGNAAYFDPRNSNHNCLGIDYIDDKLSQGPVDGIEHASADLWLENIYVCEYCFKYTADDHSMSRHRPICIMNAELPKVGKLVYRDDETPFVIRHIRGYQNVLFCQNLCLFSKLFLDDKSVYYNVSQFDFYVVYGFDSNDMSDQHSKVPNFKPMGFFSKELVSWDGDNNLACICVFPPYQRQHIGSLLIEFSYEVARLTPGQYLSGPEFPLSPFGKVTYLNFWSRKLAGLLLRTLSHSKQFELKTIANLTGYRKEDILLTLEYMKVVEIKKNRLTLMLGNLRRWCLDHHIDPSQESAMIKEDGLLL